jgi:hypothetical protein
MVMLGPLLGGNKIQWEQWYHLGRSPAEVHSRFRGIYCLHFQRQWLTHRSNQQ